jgi:hypothetical protein
VDGRNNGKRDFLVHRQATSSKGAYHAFRATTETKGRMMKTIPVEQLDEQLAKALEQQDQHEAIRLTKDAGTVAWLLRVPETMKDTEADVVVYTEGPAGRIFFIVQAKHVFQGRPEQSSRTPVFGAGRGTLTIVSEDDEHLSDFKEYME